MKRGGRTNPYRVRQARGALSENDTPLSDSNRQQNKSLLFTRTANWKRDAAIWSQSSLWAELQTPTRSLHLQQRPSRKAEDRRRWRDSRSDYQHTSRGQFLKAIDSFYNDILRWIVQGLFVFFVDFGKNIPCTYVVCHYRRCVHIVAH